MPRRADLGFRQPSNAKLHRDDRRADGPVTIYDPTHPFLNGGSLQNVVRKLRAAKYLYSWDVLASRC